MSKDSKQFQDTVDLGPLHLTSNHVLARIPDLERDYPNVPKHSCANMPIINGSELDFENWFCVLPSTRSLIFEGSEFYCNPIVGPHHLVFRERLLRNRHSVDELATFESRPTIVWMFGAGEDTTDRATTRLGGLPYWPQELPWPKCQNGAYFKQFVGQIDFRGVYWPEALPGDLLTIHYDEYWDGDGRFEGDATHAGAHLQWHRIDRHTKLIDASDVPPPPDGFIDIGPYYGVGALVTDYKPNCKRLPYDADVYTLHATKIGGHSLFRERTWQRRPWQEDFRNVKDPVFLCSVCTVLNAHVKDGGLPQRSAKYPRQGAEVHWLSMGWLNIVYPKGRPDALYWSQDK